MSKLAELLTERFRLLVSLPHNRPELAQAAFDAGADGIKVHLNCHHFASGTTFGNWQQEQSVIREILTVAGDRPVGIVTGDTTQASLEEMYEIIGAGLDFWDLFASHTPPEWLHLPMGRMVAVDDQWHPQLVGGLHDLGVQFIESSIVPKASYRSPLNAVDLVNYQRLVQASKPMPVVIPTQKAVEPEQVGWLQRTGASGLVIGAIVTGLEKASLHDACARFAEEIAKLPATLAV
jgi:hypothetical protein